MVLEGLAALGLASNILQLIDFSYQLVSGAKEINNSATGVSTEHETFETVSQSLIKLINNIDGASSSQIPPETRELAAQIKDLAQCFIAKLNELKPKGARKPWSGFIQAMKEANQSSKLLALNKRLNKLQRLFNIHLQNMMRSQLVDVDEMIKEDQRLQLQTTEEVQRLRNDILEELQNLQGPGILSSIKVAEHLSNLEDPEVLGIKEAKDGNKKAKTRKQKRNEEGREWISQEDVELPSNGARQTGGKPTKPKCIGQEDIKLLSNMFIRLSESMRLFPTAANIAWPRYSVLKSLWYQGMRDRQQAVPSAHSETLNWIFDGSVPDNYQGPHPGFVQWLEHEGGIFWVHGKPGSGKSTLMKFFASHPTTRQILNQWAHYGRKRLVFASHFFWTAGGTLQRSQKGLLRTLLFQILRDFPDLVPCVYPNPEAIQYLVDYNEWGFQELREAFSRLKTQTQVRICLFIDGLDEYDQSTDEGSYQELIKTLVSMSESPDIKFCVSSRSWYVFKDAFSKEEDGGLSKSAVALEDLNLPDIEAYVNSSFSGNERFRDLSISDPSYHALLNQIVQRSQGVFLWVFLVVRSLLQGLTYADRMSDLQKRLDRIPDDLNDYFKQILGSVDEVYLTETAEIFQIMLRSQTEVPLLVFSFLLEEDDGYAFNIKGWCPMTRREIHRRCEETRRRLDGRCRGLVEADKGSFETTNPYNVRFLHRTVRDFLKNKAMEEFFERLSPQFDADVSAARSYLAIIKTAPKSRLPQLFTEMDEQMYSGLMFHCRKYEIRTYKALMDVLDKAREVKDLRAIKLPGNATFFEFAAGKGLWLYLLRVVERGPEINEGERESLLYKALRSWPYRDPDMQHFCKDLVEGLLQRGTDPNNTADGYPTAWGLFLRHLQDTEPEEATNQNDLFEIGKSLIIHGIHSSKEEIKIIREAERILPIEQRRELVGLLKSRRFSYLIPTKRRSKSVRKLVDKVMKRLN